MICYNLVLFGIVPDISSFTVAASVILTLVIVFESYRAYRYTKRDYLLTFVWGFALLAVSYALLLPHQFGIHLPTLGYTNGDILTYPPRLVIESAGFILIGLAYSRTPWAKYLLYSIVALLIVLVSLVILPIAPKVPFSVDALLHFLNLVVICYILYHMLEKTRPTDLVMIAFLIMAVNQYTGIIDTLQTGELTVFLVQITRVLSLIIFFVAFLRVPERRPIETNPVRDS